MRNLQVKLLLCIPVLISANFQNDRKYIFKVTDQHFSTFNIKGRVVPPLDTVFTGELHIQALPNNTYYGRFFNTTWDGNINNKGNIEMPFIVEMFDDRIDQIKVSTVWNTKGVRYVYDVIKDLVRDYSAITGLNASVHDILVNLPFGQCNTSVLVQQSHDERIIETKSDKSKCELDEDLIQIIGDDAKDVLTDDTFNEVKLHQKVGYEEEPFVKLEITKNIRAEDASKDFLFAMISFIEFTFVEDIRNGLDLNISDALISHTRKEILEY